MVFLVFANGGALANTQLTAKVKTDRVNLRARPDLQSETLGQVGAGAMLAVRGTRDGWVEVVPPDMIDFWVHKDFLDQDTVLVNKLNVRSGAGINYNVVGTFAKGDTVVRKGGFGEWVKVGPPSDASAWISADLVDVMNPALAIPPPRAAPRTVTLSETAVAPTSATASVTAAPGVPPSPAVPSPPSVLAPADLAAIGGPVATAPALPTVAPSDMKLLPVEGQGRLVQREGELKRAPVLMARTPGSHRLIRREGNKLITTAYVRGNREQLEMLVNQMLVVQGREYWVEGVQVPVIVVDTIEKRR